MTDIAALQSEILAAVAGAADEAALEAVRVGAPVELFGGSIDLDDFASRSGTIGYHLLTSLGPRYQREYVR